MALYYKLNSDEQSYAVIGCDLYAAATVNIPSEHDGLPVTRIGDFAFAGCNQLTEVVVPNGIEVIGYGAFQNCSALTTLVIPESVIQIGAGAFSGCTGLCAPLPDGIQSAKCVIPMWKNSTFEEPYEDKHYPYGVNGYSSGFDIFNRFRGTTDESIAESDNAVPLITFYEATLDNISSARTPNSSMVTAFNASDFTELTMAEAVNYKSDSAS